MLRTHVCIAIGVACGWIALMAFYDCPHLVNLVGGFGITYAALDLSERWL